MYRCPRMLTTMTVSMMQANIEKKLGKSVSRGSIYALKPFFCVEPTDREKSLCLCKICLNTRQIFDAVGGCCKKNTAANFPVSISEYFMANCKCEDKDTKNCILCRYQLGESLKRQNRFWTWLCNFPSE